MKKITSLFLSILMLFTSIGAVFPVIAGEETEAFVVENNIASTNRITREFNIGFNRAQEIFVTLEEYGIISELAGTKARDVLVTLEELEEILSNEK